MTEASHKNQHFTPCRVAQWLINSNGELEAKKRKKYRPVYCPFSRKGTYVPGQYIQRMRPCGDWCALFSFEHSYINLCHGVLKGPIQDERVQE